MESLLSRKPRTDKPLDAALDPQRALEVFRLKLIEQKDGHRPNSQMKRDAELIVKLLTETGEKDVRLSVFTSTFEALFDMPRDKAGVRSRSAIKFLESTGRIRPTGDKHPVYSLTTDQSSENADDHDNSEGSRAPAS